MKSSPMPPAGEEAGAAAGQNSVADDFSAANDRAHSQTDATGMTGHPAEPPAPNPNPLSRAKVFGIGLSKTGTSSLTQALRILGYRSIHYPPLDNMLSILAGYDAATDTTIACCYDQLDVLYPNSKFILTVRDVKSWLVSAEREFAGRPVNEGWKQTVRTYLYGAKEWDPGKFADGYRRHCQGVETYFRHRPLDLLTMNIVAGEGWGVLCSFLGTPAPTQPFPHCNSTRYASACDLAETRPCPKG